MPNAASSNPNAANRSSAPVLNRWASMNVSSRPPSDPNDVTGPPAPRRTTASVAEHDRVGSPSLGFERRDGPTSHLPHYRERGREQLGPRSRHANVEHRRGV